MTNPESDLKKSAKRSGQRKGTQRRSPVSVHLPAPVELGRDLRALLQVAQIRAEKCELKEAREAYQQVWDLAKSQGDLRNVMEALAGLLRLASEALDEDELRRVDHELEAMMKRYPRQVPPMAWYCKGVIARHRNEGMLSQRYLHRFLRENRLEMKKASAVEAISIEEATARGWAMMVIILWQRGKLERALRLSDILLEHFENRHFRSVNGMLYLTRGSINERRRNYQEALKWYQKAHAAFLSEHSWYYYLYVMYGYARVARHLQNYSQANWYLDLIEAAVARPEFGLLRRDIQMERSSLAQEAVDLLIDNRQCLVRTREGGEISFRKQYVLLHILEALSDAHQGSDTERERGLSKAEIIQRVWKEKYRPEAHDNKLYYNINRLRKLIEPDARKPRYLVNWKEGYRLAPELKVQFIGSASGSGPRTPGLRIELGAAGVLAGELIERVNERGGQR